MRAASFLLIILLIGCNINHQSQNLENNPPSKDLNGQQSQNNKNYNKETFHSNVYKEDSFWLKIKMSYDSLLSLSHLDKGVDSFEIRLWTDSQIILGDNLVDIKYENGKWLNKKYFFVSQSDVDLKKILTTYHLNYEGSPYASKNFAVDKWISEFQHLLKDFDLENFPTQASLKDYHGCL
jgi:hypothetical protein